MHRAALLTLITLAGTACSDPELGSAAPPVPIIDVCVKATVDAATEVCYSDEKLRRHQELCGDSGECLLPELSADLGRVIANSTGSLTVTVKNKGEAPLTLFNPTVTPGSSTRYRLDPAQRPGDNVYIEIPGKEKDDAPPAEAQFEVQLRGSVCGEHNARLVLTSNDADTPPNAPAAFDPGQPDSPIYLDVSGFVGGPCLCALPPSRLDFGDVAVSQTKKRRFSFENCGDEDLTISDTTIGVNSINGDVFAIDATIYPPDDVLTAGAGEQAHIDVTYAPETLSPPADGGELWIHTNAPTSQPYHVVPLSGDGVPRPACIFNAIPNEANFGVVDGTRDRTFRLYNSGQIACRFFDIQQTSGSADFAITAGVPAPEVPMQPNQSHEITITYGPSDDQFDEAVFTATADDIDGFESTATISVTGNPALPDEGCILDIQPDFGDFGDVTVGQTKAMDFKLSNVGEMGGGFPPSGICNINSVELSIGAPDYKLGDLGGFIGGLIMPGMDSSMTVFFEPQTEGVKVGILHFDSNDAMSAGRDVQLWGNALGARLCVDPTGAAPATVQCGATQPCATVDYGMTTADANRDVTLTNCGAGTLRIRGINMDPAGGLAFVKTAPAAQDLPIELGAGQSTVVSVKYRPTNEGGDFGAFDVLSNASNAELARVSLRGNYDGNCPTILRCVPNPMVMGSHEVGVPAIQTAVCSNFGTDTFWVNNVSMSGDSSLSIVSSSTGELDSGDSFVVQVQCFPQNPGMKTGTVSISSDACDAPLYNFEVSCNGLDIPVTECIGADTFEPYEMWRWTGTPGYPDYDDVWMTPVVINLTDDNSDGAVDALDTPDVIFTALRSNMDLFGGGNNGGGMTQDEFCHANDAQPAIVVAVSGDTGAELWAWGTLPVGDPGDPNALVMEAESTLAAADIDADGRPEIIGIKYTYIPPADNCEATDPGCCLFGKFVHGNLIALEHDGTFKWESERWHQPESVGENAAAISIGDMNGDGIPEISMGNAVFDNNGLLIFEGLTQSEGEPGHGEGGAGHGAISVFADLDLDGTNELVAGRTAFDHDGSVIWNRRDMSDGLTTVANLDADDYPEIILLTGGDDLYVLEHDGTTKYGPEHIHSGNFDDEGNEEGFIPTNPAIGDLDGDGFPEIVVSATNNIWAYEHTLQVKWSATINDQTGASGPTTFDFEGDGKAEVLHADESNIQMFDGTTGAVKYTAPRGSRTIVDNPVVVDVDNDGHADILVALENPLGDMGMYGLIAYSNAKNNWVGTRRVWNQHSYHITNISESGVVPAFEGAGWLEHNVYRSNVIYCE